MNKKKGIPIDVVPGHVSFEMISCFIFLFVSFPSDVSSQPYGSPCPPHRARRDAPSASLALRLADLAVSPRREMQHLLAGAVVLAPRGPKLRVRVGEDAARSLREFGALVEDGILDRVPARAADLRFPGQVVLQEIEIH